jgi:hypothetical protein
VPARPNPAYEKAAITAGERDADRVLAAEYVGGYQRNN